MCNPAVRALALLLCEVAPLSAVTYESMIVAVTAVLPISTMPTCM